VKLNLKENIVTEDVLAGKGRDIMKVNNTNFKI